MSFKKQFLTLFLAILALGTSAQAKLEFDVRFDKEPVASAHDSVMLEVYLRGNGERVNAVKPQITLPEGFSSTTESFVKGPLFNDKVGGNMNWGRYVDAKRVFAVNMAVPKDNLGVPQFTAPADWTLFCKFSVKFDKGLDQPAGDNDIAMKITQVAIVNDEGKQDGGFKDFAYPETVNLAISDGFILAGEPLTQNGTEDFSDVDGYNPLIQGINYAFSGSKVWDKGTNAWKEIDGSEILITDLVETDIDGVPVFSEEDKIFRIVNNGVDNIELYSVPNAYGQSYLKFSVVAKAYPKATPKTFIMSYVVDAMDDPTIVSTEAGDGVEGQPYSITVDIYDVDLPNKDDFMIFVDRDNYKYYIKIGEKLIPADSIVHYELPTTFTVNSLPFDVVANVNGSRTPSQTLTVQAVFEKLYPPGKGDFTYSEPVEVTFTDVDQAPVELNAPTVTISAGPYRTDSQVVIDDFIVEGNLSDADGDEIKTWYYWTKGGEEYAGATIPSTAKKGETWTPHVRVYTRPYGEDVTFKAYAGEPITIVDSPIVIASQPASLYFFQDHSDQARVSIVMSDPDIADGNDVYTVDEFSVHQSLNKGVITDKRWDASKQEFSFNYRLTDLSAANEGLTLSVVLSHGGVSLSTNPIAVHYEVNKPPQWTSGLALTVAEGSPVTLDLATKVTDPNQSDILRFSIGKELPAGILAEVTGSVLKVSASYEAVTGQEGTKVISLPVTVTDGLNPPVHSQLTLTVTDENRLPEWQGNLALSLNENEQGQLDLAKLVSDPDADNQLSIKAGAISREGVTVSQVGNILKVSTTYDAVKGELDAVDIPIPVTATDGVGEQVESTVTLTVSHVNRAPVALVPSIELTSGVDIAFDSFFEDPDGDALSYVISDLSACQLVDRDGQPVKEGEPVAADRFPLSVVRPDNQAMTATFRVVAEDFWQDRSEAVDGTLTLSSQVLLQLTASGLISAEGEYQAQLSMIISEPSKDTYPQNSSIHSLKAVVSLPKGFVPNLDAMEIVYDLNQYFYWKNRSSFDAATGQLTLDVSAEVREGETLPLGNFSPTSAPAQLLTVPLVIGWTPEMVGTYKLKASFSEMTVGENVDGQFVAVPTGPEAVRLTVSDLEIYSDFLMAGEPLTQNGTEDFADVEGYNPLIQGINYAFSGSGIYNPDTQAWESIGGREIEIHDLVETDAEGVPVSEEKHIFRIVNKGVDNFELYSVPNANGHSYLKFTLAAKRYPKAERSFLMSYVVDAADDPTIVSTEAGDGVEGQPYSITVDISDVDLPNKDDFMIFVDRDNYKHYIKIGEKLIPADSIVHYELPTTFTVNALPFDVVTNANGFRTPSQTLTVQAVFEKLYPPGKGDFTYSEPVEATFADVDHLPEGVDFELQLASSGKTDDDAVAECKLVAGSDADGDEIRYQATWSLNGSDKTVAGLTLPASETQKGQTWSFKAEAYTQPYGEPIMTGVIKTATYVVDDTLPVITAQTENLHLRNDQSTSATVTVTIADSDIADGTDVYTVDNFSVIQSQVKGVISGQTWNPETQSFSFDYRIANPQEGIAAEDGVNVVVEVSHSGSKVSTKPIPVTYVLERPPKWTGDLVLNMNENESRTLDLNELAEDANGDPLTFGGGILKETGFDSSLEGTMLTVNASYKAVATGEQPKQFRIPVTVKDAYSDAVSGTLVVTVTNVNRAPSWTGELALSLNENETKSLDLTALATDLDDDALTFGEGTLKVTGFTATLAGKSLLVETTYEAVTTAEKIRQFRVPVTVKDAQGEAVRGTVTVTVTNVNRKPAWNETLTLSMKENESQSLDLTKLAKDPDGDELTFGEGTLTETGFTAKLEGKKLTVEATHEAVSHKQPNEAERTKTFDISVTVKDAQSEDVCSTILVTVTDVNQAPVATMEEKQFDYGCEMPLADKEFFEELDGDDMTYVVTGLNLGRILDTKKNEVKLGEHLNADRFPLLYEKEEGADPVPVSFQIVAVDSLKAKSEAMMVKIVMHTSQLASELWGGKEIPGGMFWRGLHLGWNLLAVPFDMTGDDFKNFHQWLIPDGSFWGWKADETCFKPLTSLRYNDGFWVFIEKLPQEDFRLSGQLVSERPKPYGWQLVSKVWAWGNGNQKAFLYNSEIGGLMRVSDEDSPYVGVWQYFPQKKDHKTTNR